jgi:hypothetical protein
MQTGPLPNGAFAYEVTAVIQNGNTSVQIYRGIPDETGTIDDRTAVDDAKVRFVGAGGASVELRSVLSMFPAGVMLPDTGVGLYTTASGQMLAANGGERYTLEVDVDGNGSVDASASCTVPGQLSWIVPMDGGTYDSSGFSAAWSDSAASDNTQYIAVLRNDDSNAQSPGAAYSGPARSFTPDPALAAGRYTATLQSLASSVDFAGVSVQGQLLCGTVSLAEVQFTLR